LGANNPLARRAAVCLLLGAAAAAFGAAPPQTRQLPRPPAQKKPKVNLFSPVDLGLLEAPDRAQWQKPEQIMDALGIADGSIVADVGAAGGWFTIRLAHRVGPNGVVYAEDIQAQMIESIKRRMQRENLLNVTPVLGAVHDAHLPYGLDAVLIDDVYPEMEDPVTLLRNVANALKPQGRLGVVDWSPGGGGPGPALGDRVDPQTVISAAAAAGLQLTSREVLPFQFLLVFRKQPTREVTPSPSV